VTTEHCTHPLMYYDICADCRAVVKFNEDPPPARADLKQSIKDVLRGHFEKHVEARLHMGYDCLTEDLVALLNAR
jgi:hypothetical protein